MLRMYWMRPGSLLTDLPYGTNFTWSAMVLHTT